MSHSAAEACRILEDHGADVVGLNCYRGPDMTMKLLPSIREKVSCHVSASQFHTEQMKNIQLTCT